MFVATEVAELIRERFGPAFIETLRRDTIFGQLVEPKKERFVEKDIRWKINYAGNASVGSFTELQNFGVAGEQAYETALLDWKLNKVVIRVTGLAQALSQSQNSIINAIATETEQAMRDLKRQINLQLLSDGAGNLNGANPALAQGGAAADITGIQAAVDDGSLVPTYAGIDRTVNVWWQSFVSSNGGIPRPLSEALMFQVWNELKIRGGKVTHILCSYNTWTRYGLLLEQVRRRQESMRMEGGFDTLQFNGVPVIAVPDYEEGRMDFIDMDQIKWKILQDFSVEPRDPGSFDASQFFVKHYSQFVYENPWLAGSLRDIQA